MTVHLARTPFVMNQSSWKEFLNCKRKFAWRKFEKLEPEGRRSALDIGTAIHKGLAAFHSGGKTVEDVVQISLTEARTLAGPKMTWADKTFDEVADIIVRVLPAYFDYWGDRNELWTPLNQEVEFCVEVGDGTANFLRGKSDNLSTYKNGLYIVDYKTAGRNDPRDFAKYELDCQLTAYLYGLTKHLTEESLRRGGEPVFVRGAIIDALIKTKVPQFVREFYTRTIEELAEFEAEFNECCDEIRTRRARVADGEPWKTVFYKNTEECFTFGTCSYRDICLKDTPVRRKLYVVRKEDYVDEAQARLDAQWKEQNA